jgi:uncharacterized membrane protein
MFPALPPWDGLHPIVVHFPIALLLVAPVFLLAGLLRKSWARSMAAAALIVMALGTASAILAMETGEAAGEVADRTPEINEVLGHHAELAEKAVIVFSALAVVALLLTIVLDVWKREALGRYRRAAFAVFLLVYLGATLLVVQTGHLGGRLVHEFGLKAAFGESSSAQGQ